MEKSILEKYINQGLSSMEISKISGKSQTTISYWMKKYKLKSNHLKFGKKEYGDHRICPKCKTSQSIKDFYNRRDKSGSSSYCKFCVGREVLERVRRFKSLMVEYKGGECIKCGYKKYQGALEFHHIDPTKKDFSPSKFKMSKFNDKIKNELDKCILVCSNCHKEIHNEIAMEKYVVPTRIELV